MYFTLQLWQQIRSVLPIIEIYQIIMSRLKIINYCVNYDHMIAWWYYMVIFIGERENDGRNANVKSSDRQPGMGDGQRKCMENEY